MMFKKCTRLMIAVTLSVGLLCCKKGSTGPAGPAGPAGHSATSGVSEITGHVSYFDQYGTRQLGGLNNVKLVLQNGNYTFADSSGYYILPGLPSAGYVVSATASGCGATQFVANLAGDTVYHDIKLSAIPTFQVQTFNAYHNTGSTNDSLVLNFTADTRARSCIVFAGYTRAVSSQPANYILAYTKAIPANATHILIQVPVTDLNGANIYFGQEVYYAACSYVVNDVSVYEDWVTGRNVYNSTGTPMIDSTIAP